LRLLPQLFRLGSEEAEKIHAAIGVESEGGAGEGRIDEFVVAGDVRRRVVGQVVKAHRGTGKEAGFGRTAHENKETGVAGIVLDGVGEFADGFFFPSRACMKLRSL